MTEAAPSYRIDLPLFEGPLDLLLHLIKKEQIEIHNIPVAKILEQYMEYLSLAKELNIDLAGEFLEMAAELAYIKSKMLLPQSAPEKEEPEDPRDELVRRLLEYQRFKMAASRLLERPMLGREVFWRQPTALDTKGEEEIVEIDTITLLASFQKLLKQLPKEASHEIRRYRVGVAERVLELMERLQNKERVLFETLFENDRSRSELVVTLLALLEMARQRLVRVIQETRFGAIVICPLFFEGESDKEENGSKTDN